MERTRHALGDLKARQLGDLRCDDPRRSSTGTPGPPPRQRNVKHWSSREMCLGSTASGMLEAEEQSRKGHRLHRAHPASPSRSNADSTCTSPPEHDPGGRDRSH